MISKSFLKSSIIYTLGGSLPMVASFILLPFYTNFLSTIQYTQVSFYISVSLLLQIFFSYTTENYFGIKYSRLFKDPEAQKKFVGTVSVLLLLIGCGLLFLCAAIGDLVFSNIFNPALQIEFWPYGFWSVLTAFFNSYFKTSSTALIYFKKPWLYLAANIANFIVTLGISIGGLYLLPGSIAGPIYGRLISGVVIFVLGHYIFISNGELKLDKSFLKELQEFCTPYLIYVVSGWCLNFFDRYILQEYTNATDLNTYDLILKCFFGIAFLQNTITAVFFPKLYELWAKQTEAKTTKETNRYFNVFTAINIILLSLFCIAIPVLYKLLIHNESFYESERYIGILAAGYALNSILSFYLSTILYTKNVGILIKTFGISAAFQVALSYLTISKWGVTGAIYAGLAVKIVQVFLLASFTKKIFIYDFNYLKIFGIPLLFMAVNVILFNIIPGYSILNYSLQLVAFSLIFYFIFQKELFAVLKSF